MNRTSIRMIIFFSTKFLNANDMLWQMDRLERWNLTLEP
jgi:hypothetical protein